MKSPIAAFSVKPCLKIRPCFYSMFVARQYAEQCNIVRSSLLRFDIDPKKMQGCASHQGWSLAAGLTEYMMSFDLHQYMMATTTKGASLDAPIAGAIPHLCVQTYNSLVSI